MKRFNEVGYYEESNELNDNFICNQKFVNNVLEDLSELSTFENCIFDSTKFVGDFNDVTFINCLFDKCEMSNCSFIKCNFLGCKTINSHLVGTNIVDSKIDTCDILDSNLKYSNFNSNIAHNLIIKNNSFMESSITDINIKNIDLDSNDFQASEVYGTKLNGVDITSNKIDRISIEPNSVKGMICDEVQAITLVGILGILTQIFRVKSV